MEILKIYNYRRELEHILYMADYDCSKYAPMLLWANDHIDSLANCWDYFHREVVEYITSTPEWENMWREDLKA